MSEVKRVRLSDVPKVAEATEKENSIKAEISANDERISWIYSELARRGSDGYKDSNIFQKALSRLGAVADPNAVETSVLKKELEERLQNQPVLNKALELATAHVQTVTFEESKKI